MDMEPVKMDSSNGLRGPCPRCGWDRILKNGFRGKERRQSYRCRKCRYVWSERVEYERVVETVVSRGGGDEVLEAAYWVASNMSLKGGALQAAKRRASGLALSLLEAVLGDAAFKRTFLNTMIPKLFLNEKRMEREKEMRRDVEMMEERIEGMIAEALRASVGGGE